jgi:hypothetical protein
LRGISLDASTEEQILRLSPDDISELEVRDVLVHAPAPRIINLHGSIPVITMKPFAEFLIAMGYPENSVRNPKDGTYSYSSYTDSEQLAGTLAWYYEHEGMMPMLIGHSQGGMLVIKVLHELAGDFNDAVPVWNPLTDKAEATDTVIDPVTGARRTVIGLRVPYATAIATGRLMRVLLGQWNMLSRLRRIPDTADEFTGFTIEGDPLTVALPGFGQSDSYQTTGSAVVRNVMLPSSYGHVSIPLTGHLAAQEITRAWINRYNPDRPMQPLPTGTAVDTTNIMHAADIWFSVKKHWCLEAKRLIRARRDNRQAEN